MIKRLISSLLLILFLFSASGCAIIGTAIGAGIAYGISQISK